MTRREIKRHARAIARFHNARLDCFAERSHVDGPVYTEAHIRRTVGKSEGRGARPGVYSYTGRKLA